MKFNSLAIAGALFCSSSTTSAYTSSRSSAFTNKVLDKTSPLSSPAFALRQHKTQTPHVLYASTLEQQEQEQKEKLDDEKNDEKTIESDDVLAVSATHVFQNGKLFEKVIQETNSSSDNAKTLNSVSPIRYMEEEEVENDHHKIIDEPISLSSSDSISPVISSHNDGIKMTKSNNLNNLPQQKKVEEKAPFTNTNVKPKTEPVETSNGNNSFSDRIASSGVASAAAMATAAVNAAVSMRTLQAPDVSKSYIAIDSASKDELDEDGLPLVYDKNAIELYWKKERGALNQRWNYFVSKAVPFLTRLVTLFIKDGKIEDKYIGELSEKARIDIQDLGPTFIKAGQMMSVRPDVLPTETLDELTKLQDAVVPFSTSIAVEQIERELGGPLGQFFTSISDEPVAAASLAQVYKATLNDGKDTEVAIKVQRPDVLATVSKDLYVLRRAAEVFQGLVERFAPQQRTNYVSLLNEWAIGFYTELDFQNEGRNQQRLRDAFVDNNIQGITVPRVHEDLCTRRILVSEWMDGVKLSSCSDEEIGKITPICQEAFLTQLFEVGFFHADPHPGNILKLNEPTAEGHTVALIDCGLMASIDPVDRDNMISAVIHLANKDYASLVDDFMNLEILPRDSDRAAIIPLMDKALSPYVKGGGAKKYEEELLKIYGMEDGTVQSTVGGFQAMTQDALTVLNDVPFSIPPYFAILGRAIVTLEGIALTGNPDYGIIMESYPFIARKLMREDRPEVQRALQEVLYSGDSEGGAIKFNRLLALLNNAAGSVSTQEGAAFVDLDSVPEDGLSFDDGLKYLLSDKAESLRNLLEGEVDTIVDILTRQIFRQGVSDAIVNLTPPRPPALPLLGNIFPASPKLDEIPVPILLPGLNGNAASVGFLTLREFSEKIAPKLSQDEEIYALGLSEGASELFGEDVAQFLRGESVLSVKSVQLLLTAVRSGGFANANDELLNGVAAESLLNGTRYVLGALGSDSTSGLEDQLESAISNLDEIEKTRLDEIISEVTQRTISRASARLADVNRVV